VTGCAPLTRCAGWAKPWMPITTLGPKQQGRADFGPDLVEAASVLVTDSLDQVDAYDPPNILVGTDHANRLVSLGAVRAGDAAGAAPEGIALFFSVGLAGTEAFLLDRLAAEVERARPTLFST
jgi:ornithine cyclodeaminase/alanine dehydrogenase-like protein (mu-crystallin family)